MTTIDTFTRRAVLVCGDSIFDNTPYVGNGTDLRTHLSGAARGWNITFEALDGAICEDVLMNQLNDAQGYNAVLLSVGGNNALEHIHLLSDPSGRTFLGTALMLGEIQDRFRADYRAVLEAARDAGDRLLACTIYRPRYNLEGYPSEAIRAIDPLLSVFNDVIQEEVRNVGADLLDLRSICTTDEDFANPIEPSDQGGRRIAEHLADWLRTQEDAQQGRDLQPGGA